MSAPSTRRGPAEETPEDPGPARSPVELRLGPDEVTRLLERSYGLRVGAVVPLGGEAASIYRVSTTRGEWAFKAFAAAPGLLERVRWQSQVQAALHDAGLPVPGVLADRRGDALTELRSGAGLVLVQVMDWLPGVRLADVPPRPGILRRLGHSAAALQRALRDAPRPPQPFTHTWDLRRSAEVVRGVRESVLQEDAARLLARTLDLLDAEVAPLLEHLPTGVVHQDLNDFNVLVDPRHPSGPAVSGIIDFDDMIVGLRVAEPVIAAVYASRGADDPVQALVTTVGAFHARLPLSDVEIGAVLPLAAARLAVNTAVWAHRADGPRGRYARARSAGSVPVLARLLEVGSAEVAERVLGAAGSGR